MDTIDHARTPTNISKAPSMRHAALTLALLLANSAPLFAADMAPERILTWFHLLKPLPSELSVYQLDWEASLNTAQERALAEGRPVCLLAIHARYGDIASGHC